jgi:hypothetical protein
MENPNQSGISCIRETRIPISKLPQRLRSIYITDQERGGQRPGPEARPFPGFGDHLFGDGWALRGEP